ncbi:SAM-dependent methyltransferase [Enterovirga rhinocerotis]
MIPETDHPVADSVAPARREGAMSRWLLRRVLSCVAIGRLTVVTPGGEHLSAGPASAGLQAVLILKSWRAVRRLLLDGDIGLAEAYRDGDIDTPDLTALIELLARNAATLRQHFSGALPARMINRFRHLLNANTRAGSSRNIMAHYDLGNAFYARWLDEQMVYSSALYDTSAETLESAQQRKLDRIVDMLGLTGREHVLEIGCGWGALTARLAREGCRVTAVTLSPAQLAVARERAAREGLADRVDIQLRDYRDIAGEFDRIVSIEMIEAVGRAYWPSYFGTLARSLRPGGRAVLQSITIDERFFESYQRGTDFIQRHIFPGGCLPSVTAIEREAARAALRVEDRFDFGASYALTLREWRHRFVQNWGEILKLGFDEPFRRLWEFYLCYCEAGFRATTINVRLLTLRHSELRLS